jgi:hypothetical protein
METTLYVDSRQRDVSLYPSGNSYTLFLQSPVHNVSQVDLISAKIPNTMYNLTTSSNVLAFGSLFGSSNVALNPGFYSTCSLVDTFNNTSQVSNVAMSYLEAEGKFLFTGNLTSVTTLTQEISEILGLPLGTTLSSPIATNAVYKGLYPTANAYVVSSNIVSLETNDYIWLDIEEFRTPFTTDARQLILNPQGVYTTTSNTSARSFAIIPMDVPSGGIKSFREAADYPVYVTFPSRLDSLDRLTISWLDRNGKPLDFHGLDVNSFTLRLHTIHVPDQVERPVSLPPPVPFEKDNQKVVWGAIIALVIGLMLIILAGKKKV